MFKQKVLFHIILAIILTTIFGILTGCPIDKGTTDIKIQDEDSNSTGSGNGNGNGGNGTTTTTSNIVGNLCVNNSINHQVLSNDGILYLGGAFTRIGVCTGPGIITNTTNGDLVYAPSDSNFQMFNGQVEAAISDGNGGFYVGGRFTKVGDVARNRLAHIDASGNLTSFDPGADNRVLTLLLSNDKSKLYVGGVFENIGGEAIRRLAAINTADGSVITGFNPNPDTSVYSLVLNNDESILYVGGIFASMGGTARESLAAVNTSDGSLITGFNANIAVGYAVVWSMDLTDDESTLYIGGHFTNIAGTSRNYLAAVNATDGSLTSFNPNASVFVYSITLNSDESILYFGGSFNTVGGVTQKEVAAVYTSNGSRVTDFSPVLNNTVQSVSLTSDDSKLYVGGWFTTANGETRNNVAVFNTSDGSLISEFDPDSSFRVYTTALNNDESKLFVGGLFDSVRAENRQYVAAIDTSDYSLVADFAPEPDSWVFDLALSSDGSKLYISGWHWDINNVERPYVAAVNTSDGSLISDFYVNPDWSVNTIELSSDDSTLYIGGDFWDVGGTTRPRAAAVNTTDGSVITSFYPYPEDEVLTMALSSDNSKLYLGGEFTDLDGTARNYVGAVNTSDGSVIAAFNPNVDGYPSVLSLNNDESILYIGGDFNNVGGTARSNIAAVNTSDGSLVATFNPNASSDVLSLLLSTDESILYMGGWFSTVGGTTRSYIAAVNTSDGSVVSGFDPNASSSINSITYNSDKSRLFFGGDFLSLDETFKRCWSPIDPSDGSIDNTP